MIVFRLGASGGADQIRMRQNPIAPAEVAYREPLTTRGLLGAPSLLTLLAPLGDQGGPVAIVERRQRRQGRVTLLRAPRGTLGLNLDHCTPPPDRMEIVVAHEP